MLELPNHPRRRGSPSPPERGPAPEGSREVHVEGNPSVPLGHQQIAEHVFTTGARGWQQNLKTFARQNRRQPTPAEASLWQAVRGSRLGVRCQHAIGTYIVDFICVSAHLTIELDGGIHQEADQADYDHGRTQLLTESGYHELRFTND